MQRAGDVKRFCGRENESDKWSAVRMENSLALQIPHFSPHRNPLYRLDSSKALPSANSSELAN